MRAPLLSTRTDWQAAGFDRLPLIDLTNVHAPASPPCNRIPEANEGPGAAVGVDLGRAAWHAVTSALPARTRLRRRNSRRWMSRLVMDYSAGCSIRILAVCAGTEIFSLPPSNASMFSPASRSYNLLPSPRT